MKKWSPLIILSMSMCIIAIVSSAARLIITTGLSSCKLVGEKPKAPVQV